MTEKSKAWGAKSLGVEGGTPIVRHHPSELMLRALFSSRYSGLAPQITAKTRVLDVGAMYLNNLVPFADRGCQCHGIEINEDMAAISRQAARDQGIGAEIRVGSNRAIPYEDARFDILKIHSRRMNLMRGIDLRKISAGMNAASGAETKAVCTEAGMFALRERRVHVTQEDFEMAVAKVMKRDSEKNMSRKKLWK